MKPFHNLSLFLAAVIAFSCLQPAGAQVSLTGTATSYSQNFNTLANSGSTHSMATMPEGWFFAEVEGTNANTTYRIGNGSSNTADTYSFGATNSTDRALGSLTSGSIKTIAFGAAFTNNTGQYMTDINISVVNEQWRRGNNTAQQPYIFLYAYDLGVFYNEDNADDFNPLPAGNLNTIQTGGPAAALDGNAAANRATVSFNIPDMLEPGETLWIAWVDVDNAGEDHGNAIDDFVMSWSLSACPPLQVSIAGPSSVCAGQQQVSLTASVNAGEGSQFTWILPDQVSTITGATLNVGTLTSTSTYTVSVTNSCGTAQASRTINVYPQPDITSIVLNPAGPNYCGNPGEVTITVNQIPNVTYSYQTNNGFLDQDGNVGIYDNISNGQNFVIVSVYVAGCSDSDTVFFNVNTQEVTPIFNPIPPVCQFGTAPALPSTSQNGITGLWSPQEIMTLSPGMQTFTFTPNPGQCALPVTLDVMVNPIPTAAINPVTAVFTGQPVTLTASGGVGYSWSNGANTEAITVSQVGTYMVTVTNQNGCTNQASAVVVQGQPACAPLILNPPVVNGNTAFLSWQPDNSHTGYRIQFRKRTNPASAWISFLLPAGTTSYTTFPLPKGTYHWRVNALCANGVSTGFVRGTNFRITANVSPLVSQNSATTNYARVYPNPTSGYLTVNLPDTEVAYQIRLTDLTGRTVYAADAQHVHEFDVTHLADGTYNLTIIGNDGYVETTRVMIAK